MNKILFLLIFILVVIGVCIKYDQNSEYGLVSGIAGYMINQECQRQLSKPLRIQGLGTIDLSGERKPYCSCVAERNKRKLNIKEVAKMVDPQVRQQRVAGFVASQAEVCSL
ncbi:hypothetical protein [Snodgrassella alvi]|uniref:Uncharacterized protein n=1 Tax=Snodgrassella alvi TaxID=1196083 RepID=A0A2N9WSJ0_9NEIS|nr:hypothetical protein [Snodgrassella alvi]PIT12538.1 hypothetical protein BGI33_10665 [Snodgrassella alvi]PIT13829.1 hypothetical protein BGI32_08465 [Snodgrassella alvi]PIT17044.1 hypothetical protein BGI34_08445 [Snodgrassella alvi]